MTQAVQWTTEYEGVSNSFGYHVHNTKAREALVSLGYALDENAPVAVSVSPPHRFEAVAGKANVAYFAWEAAELPELFRTTLAPADVLCVPASFLVEPLRLMFPDKPCFVVPLGVDAETFTYVDRSRGDLRPNFKQRPFRFLWCGAPSDRKGGAFVLETWNAFKENNRFELYFKTSLPEDSKVRKGVIRAGNIIYDDRKLPIEQLVSLYHRAHAYLFPSLGEGFGLTFAEALATGLPAIYPAATSLTDIAPPHMKLGYPVEFEWIEQNWSWSNADARGTPMSVKAKVAAASTLDLGLKMGAIAKDPLAAFARGARASEFVRASFTWNRCGKLLAQAVEVALQRKESAK